ncbi:hypothetical protein PV327_001632 [Microctonus hyperodae]|uniref:Uncharacterized protein n=1 Tax=Microctonus hyperodae TaxID=165561 RepID=A0AA39KN84_MICHY|nr:hypothetical protein PV327_001632 [Microctonus hyperodae]
MGLKKFALVWWLQSKETSVVPLTSVLPKKNRCVNSIVKLQWKGQSKMLQAKIMAISDKKLSHLHEVSTESLASPKGLEVSARVTMTSF